MHNKNQKTTLLRLRIKGMTCPSCRTHVLEALQNVPGTEQVAMGPWNEGWAEVSTTNPDLTQYLAAVSTAGYEAISDTPTRSVNPTGNDGPVDYDLIVIGTGGAGMAAAIRGAELGKRVLIIEKGTLGGTCVNIGCIPSKILMRAAKDYHRARNPLFPAWQGANIELDWEQLRRHKDRVVELLRREKYHNVLLSYQEQVHLLRATARLVTGGVEVNGNKLYRARKILIATGARPRRPAFPGLEEVQPLDSTALLALPRLPESLLVLGGRAVALEMAQIFARLGVKVTLLQRSSRLVPDHEPEIGAGIQEILEKEGIEIITGVQIERFALENGSKVVYGAAGGSAGRWEGAEILLALGRTPNTDDLGLAEVGVETDAGGFIKVDATLRTSNPDIYAAGDVTTLPKYVYVAAAAGGLAVQNAFSDQPEPLDLEILPQVIFTDPQIAWVGLTESQARTSGYSIKTTVLPISEIPRDITAGTTDGVIKLVADAQRDVLLGAQILAPEAGEIIQTAAMAVLFGRKHGFTVSDFRRMLFPYLTQVEGLKLAALTFDKSLAQLSCCAG